MILGKLKKSANGNYVTWKESKSQIRAACKAQGIGIGTFRSRKEDRRVLQVPLADGTGVVTASRSVDAPITMVKAIEASDISPELLAEIEGHNSNWKPATL